MSEQTEASPAKCALEGCPNAAKPGCRYCSRQCCVRNAELRRQKRGRVRKPALSSRETAQAPGHVEARAERTARLRRCPPSTRPALPPAQPSVPTRRCLSPRLLVDEDEALRLYAEPGATDHSVGKLLGCSAPLVCQIRKAAGVPRHPYRARDAETLAVLRAPLLLAALRAGKGPFLLRDVERRFSSCSAYAAALAVRELEALGEPDVLVRWEVINGKNPVRLVVELRQRQEALTEVGRFDNFGRAKR